MTNNLQAEIDAITQALGYHHLGGMQTNKVYLHPERQEILKVALSTDEISLQYSRAQFKRCLEISQHYANQGIMPQVLAVGDDFHGRGYPWLREQYFPAPNLGRAYLTDPELWTEQAPSELIRLYQIIMSTDKVDVRQTWQDKLAGLTCPPGFEDIYAEVYQAGEYLAQTCPQGYLIHGDLQFGNILAQREDGKGQLWLIDWEVSEVMPLGYEFAMLYTFLLGPEDQVEAAYQAQYIQMKPLKAFWSALAPLLFDELHISEAELKYSVIFRMGNGWLYLLQRAIEAAHTDRAKELEKDLRLLTSHQCFDILPYP